MPQRPRRVRIENATLTEYGLERGDKIEIHGRLILGADGLYFIHGWEEHEEASKSTRFGAEAGAIGLLVDIAISLYFAKKAKETVEAEEDACRAQLEQMRDFPPHEQMRRMPGSFHVEPDDIETVSLSWLGRLKLRTAARGEEYRVSIPRERRRVVRTWISMLERSHESPATA